MKQTVEEAAKRYTETINGLDYIGEVEVEKSFLAGAKWMAKQSPWTLIGDRSNPAPSNKPCLLLLEDGSVVEDDSNWEDKCLLVVAWMLKPSFDQIIEANKDVLQRLKEKGD